MWPASNNLFFSKEILDFYKSKILQVHLDHIFWRVFNQEQLMILDLVQKILLDFLSGGQVNSLPCPKEDHQRLLSSTHWYLEQFLVFAIKHKQSRRLDKLIPFLGLMERKKANCYLIFRSFPLVFDT